MGPLWSILVLTTPRRVGGSFISIIEELTQQAQDFPEVEVLGVFDNKVMPLGEKRNAAVRASRGRYVSFVDDDDEVAGGYVAKVYERLLDSPQVVFFEQEIRGAGLCVHCRYNPTLMGDAETKMLGNGTEEKTLLIPHTAVWERVFFEQIPFGEEMPEDMIWSRLSNRKVTSWTEIPEVLYYYNFDPSNSEWDRELTAPNVSAQVWSFVSNGLKISF